jgi:hypothetical protein
MLARQRLDQIRDLLPRARRAGSEGRQVGPAGANTASLYQEVLGLDATQPEGLAGVQRIAGVLAKEVESALAAGDKVPAERYVAWLRALQPNTGLLLKLEARLRALDASALALRTRQQGRYSLSALHIERTRSDLDHQPLDLCTIDQAIDGRTSAQDRDGPEAALLSRMLHRRTFPPPSAVERSPCLTFPSPTFLPSALPWSKSSP